MHEDTASRRQRGDGEEELDHVGSPWDGRGKGRAGTRVRGVAGAGSGRLGLRQKQRRTVR